VGKKRIGEQKGGGATKQTELREQMSLKFSGIIKLKKKAYMRQTLNTSHKTSAGSRNQTRPLISIQGQTTPCEEKEGGKRKREEVEIQPNRYAPQKWRGKERVGDQAGRRTQMQAWGDKGGMLSRLSGNRMEMEGMHQAALRDGDGQTEKKNKTRLRGKCFRSLSQLERSRIVMLPLPFHERTLISKPGVRRWSQTHSFHLTAIAWTGSCYPGTQLLHAGASACPDLRQRCD